MVKERIEALRESMKSEHLLACIVTNGTAHDKVCGGGCRNALGWLAGHDVAADALVVSHDKELLVAGTRLDVQMIADWLGEQLEANEWKGSTEVGVDGMCVSVSDVEALTTELRKRGGMTLRTNFDPFDRIWKDWKKLMMEPRKIDMRFASPELIRGRMEKVRRILRQRYHADGMLMTRMEDIAWVLGLDDERKCFTKIPVSYLLIAHDKSTLFVCPTGLSADALSCLLEAGISVDEYGRVGKGLQDYFEYNILVDPDQMPFGLMKYIKRIVVRGTVDL